MRRTGVAGVATALALALAACSGGGSSNEPQSNGSPNSEISADGEGVSLSEYGGEMLAIGEPKKGGSLRLGMIAPIDSLGVAMAQSTSATNASIAIYDTLMKVGPDGKPVPGMAESLESEDGKVWTLKLREGVTFTDGTPFNADAVIAHLTAYTAPDSQARDAAALRVITDMEAADERTVELTLAGPSVEFPQVFTRQAGMVPSPTNVEKLGDRVGLQPVGAGAFKVKSFQPGGDLVLERNPDYYDPELPYLDEIVMTTATDTQARLSALKAGSLDLASTQSVADFKSAEEAGLTVLQQPAHTYYYLALNTAKPPFDDERLRRALIQGIDTQALSTAVFEGEQPAMKGFLVSDHPEFVETDYPEFDVEAATELVDQVKADGVDPSFEVTITSPPEFQRQASVIQQMLSDIGVDMQIKVSDQPTMITEAAAGNFQAQMRFIGLTLQLTSDLQTRLHSKSPGNIPQAGTPELDRIIEELVQTPVEERSDLYSQAQEELTAWLPWTPLVQQVAGWIVSDNVGGFPGSAGEPTVDMIELKNLWAK